MPSRGRTRAPAGHPSYSTARAASRPARCGQAARPRPASSPSRARRRRRPRSLRRASGQRCPRRPHPHRDRHRRGHPAWLGRLRAASFWSGPAPGTHRPERAWPHRFRVPRRDQGLAGQSRRARCSRWSWRSHRAARDPAGRHRRGGRGPSTPAERTRRRRLRQYVMYWGASKGPPNPPYARSTAAQPGPRCPAQGPPNPPIRSEHPGTAGALLDVPLGFTPSQRGGGGGGGA